MNNSFIKGVLTQKRGFKLIGAVKFKTQLKDYSNRNSKFWWEKQYLSKVQGDFLSSMWSRSKANSVQVTCIKCLAVHTLQFEILKPITKDFRCFSFQSFQHIQLTTEHFCFIFLLVCNISNYNKSKTKHLTQGSWTELALMSELYP